MRRLEWRRRQSCCWRGTVFSLLTALVMADGAPSIDRRLAQHRNLGKAFYENPVTQSEAVAEFKKALDLAPHSTREHLNYGLALLRAGRIAEGVAQLQDVQRRDPSLPHTWFNLGIYYKKAGETEQAIAQFERLLQLAPAEPIAHYQLGTLYKLADRTADAQAQFEQAARLNPLLAAARFQLYNLYRLTSRDQDTANALEAFQQLKKDAENAAIPEDVDWCAYAEIYDPPEYPRPGRPLGPSPQVRLGGSRVPSRVLPAPASGIAAIDSTGTGQTDLLAWSAEGITLYRRGAEPIADAGFTGLSGVIFVAPGDFDNDGLMDLCVLTETGPLLYRNTGGRFARYDANLPQGRFRRAVWIDYDHDYDLDLILLGDDAALARNQGAAGFADRTADFPFEKGSVTDAFKLRVVPDTKAFDLAVFYDGRAPVLYRDQLGGRYVAQPVGQALSPGNPQDVDADFRAYIAADGKVNVASNRPPHWISIRLAGVKSLKLAQDAAVEIKAGTLYRKQTYAGVPLLFDAGNNSTVDVVRITWPNGLIQNEVRLPVNRAYTYQEAQRLSGSCPMIWTWNGRAIQFITDVLGVAPLGASDGEGTYFPVDHDEYVSIPGAALAAVDGQYDVRVTEELAEVSYIDQVQLLAIDHPADTEIFTNEKFKSPPYPEYRLFGVSRRVYPAGARDDAGRDVRPRLLAQDRQYPDQFPRSELGVAAPHTLELDFGHAAPSGRAVLLLNGWVDWPDGSTFRAAAQEIKGGLIMPYLEMQDAQGRWQAVNQDMGMPAGKPKTIAVDLRFLSASRKLRIVTNLCVYWDEIFLSEGPSEPEVRQHEVPLDSADLHFRGFSATRIHPQRKQPDTFFYENVSPDTFWNPTRGLYTRYGDVRELLGAVDDRLVLMGSGDEMRLKFRAAALPTVPTGWTRDFLLKVDGWAKDRDPNTAFGASVEPLPFHAMSRYPYPAGEHFPDDAAHARYRREYNTRPALRLIRPLGGAN